MKAALTNWKTTLAGIAVGLLLAALTVYQPGMGWKQWCAAAAVAAIGALPGILAHDGFIPKVAPVVLLLLLVSTVAMAQTPAVPAPTTNTMSFNVGAAAFGLGGAASATPASDINLSLNPGFSNKYLKTLEFRSDNLLAPGADLQYYGGGVNWVTPLKFPTTSMFAPLSFYVDGTVGVSRIVPATGAVNSHIGFMAGGGLRWLTSSGVQFTLVEVNVLHSPGAAWGNNAPAISGGLSYVFGKH